MRSCILVFMVSVVFSTLGLEQCRCGDGSSCDLRGIVPHYSCWEMNRSRLNQDCSKICHDWKGVPWEDAVEAAGGKGYAPGVTVNPSKRSNWFAAGSALELLLGNHLHCTMVYFQNMSIYKLPDHGERIIAEARALSPNADLPVRAALRDMWGCGPKCSSNSALFDVESEVAKLKYALMDHFASKGYDIERTTWGGTAHTQLIWFTREIRII